ncbi:hypothetical protein [Parolsenella catena]|uniref:hypothetical protein n=1 Tax=Parolsenella catena TaxID=2003188 RepID=UPI003AF1548A
MPQPSMRASDTSAESRPETFSATTPVRARLAQLQRRPVAVDGDAGHICHALVQAPRHGELMLPHGHPSVDLAV